METHIEFWQNIPFFCIMISMFSGIVSSVLKKEAAKRLNTVVIGIVVILSAILTTMPVNTSPDGTGLI